MHISRNPKLFPAFALALFAASLASANQITNGDFEANGSYVTVTGTMPPFGLPGLPVPTGWTDASIGPHEAAAFKGFDYVDNGQFSLPSTEAAFYGGGGLVQSFTTVAGGDYVLSFDTNGLAFGGTPNVDLMTVSLFDGAVSLASTTYMEKASFAPAPDPRTLAFTAASGTTRLEFHFVYNDPLYDGRYFALVDNVVVTDAASATPEPASWALFLVGGSLLTLTRRESKRRE
jgi:hypothetical protein